MLFGRAWCGLFCPEGTLTEFASRHGLGRAFPHWMHWGGWPFAACPGTTIYGQLVSVYDYPQAVLLVLGGWTLAAVGLSMLTLTQLRAEHVTVHADALRAALLACALTWSAWLGARILWRGDAVRTRRTAAVLLYAAPLLLTGGAWWIVFWRW